MYFHYKIQFTSTAIQEQGSQRNLQAQENTRQTSRALRHTCKYVPVCIVISSITFVLLGLLIPAVATYLINRNVEYSIQSSLINGRGHEPYGIDKGSIDAFIHDRVNLEGDGYTGNTLIVAKDLHINNAFESMNMNLNTAGPAMRELYSHKSFKYAASITGDKGFSFILQIRRTDEQGIRRLICIETITINNSTGVMLDCSSNDSGYYDAVYIVLNGGIGQISYNVSYDMINVTSYNNSNSVRCTVNTIITKCSVAVKHGYTRVIVGFTSNSESAITIKYHESHLLLALLLSLAAIIFVITCIALILWKCYTTCIQSRLPEGSRLLSVNNHK